MRLIPLLVLRVVGVAPVWDRDFSRHTIPPDEIVSGAPPKTASRRNPLPTPQQRSISAKTPPSTHRRTGRRPWDSKEKRLQTIRSGAFPLSLRALPVP